MGTLALANIGDIEVSVAQRDFVRLIWSQCRNDEQRIEVIYDGIERGVIRRERTRPDAREYADWLLHDAKRRGWHIERPQEPMSRDDWMTITAILDDHRAWGDPPSPAPRDVLDFG